MQRTELTSGLQAEQANLDDLLLKQEATRKNALLMLENASSKAPSEMVYLISRRENGEVRQIPATADTLLQPGDVLRVTRNSLATTSDGLSAKSSQEFIAGDSQ